MLYKDSLISDMREFLESFLVGLKLTHEGDLIFNLHEYEINSDKNDDKFLYLFCIRVHLNWTSEEFHIPVIEVRFNKRSHKLNVACVSGVRNNFTESYMDFDFDSIEELSKEIFHITESSILIIGG